ncbi:MAG: DNA-binding protein [Lachnospiraceae bacterium]|nr:DNA-binding protein [Lachnospiraceae bacterium]
MDKILRQSLLYDFYGELLTEHQKSIYEDVVMNDLSYSEVARLNGISRQGIYDLIKRCDKILEEYESKLKLVEKFMKAKEKADMMKDKIAVLKEKNADKNMFSLIDELDSYTSELLDDF